MNIDLWITSVGRDPFSMMSHLVGALWSLGATYVLVRRARRNEMRGLAVGVYGFTMAVAFSASVLFHFVDSGSPRYELFNRLDHSAIFLMIAGTGTGIYGAFQAQWANWLTGALWSMAILGIFLMLTFWPMPDWLAATIYLIVGWLGSLGVLAFMHEVNGRSVRLFLVGAVAYTVGAIVYAVGWPSLWPGVIGAHGVFHLLVLLGAALHFGFIWRHCTTPAFVENDASVEQFFEPSEISLDSSGTTPT